MGGGEEVCPSPCTVPLAVHVGKGSLGSGQVYGTHDVTLVLTVFSLMRAVRQRLDASASRRYVRCRCFGSTRGRRGGRGQGFRGARTFQVDRLIGGCSRHQPARKGEPVRYLIRVCRVWLPSPSGRKCNRYWGYLPSSRQAGLRPSFVYIEIWVCPHCPTVTRGRMGRLLFAWFPSRVRGYH